MTPQIAAPRTAIRNLPPAARDKPIMGVDIKFSEPRFLGNKDTGFRVWVTPQKGDGWGGVDGYGGGYSGYSSQPYTNRYFLGHRRTTSHAFEFDAQKRKSAEQALAEAVRASRLLQEPEQLRDNPAVRVQIWHSQLPQSNDDRSDVSIYDLAQGEKPNRYLAKVAPTANTPRTA